ncbi:MAG: acetyl-CoA hydrolase/transferase family protein [Clostridiales Family XIII bacterium]|nr:acetyl-CoA hydrolase/transferase family protein [Clostridiales Family XIII bacterium]
MNEQRKKRLRNDALSCRIMDAEEAAKLICDGMVVGVSGFTPSGYPKAVPMAVAESAMKKKPEERPKLTLYTGASTGSELDGAWAKADIVKRRFPYQTNDALRERINRGEIAYADMHLSLFAQYVNFGYMPKIDVAIVEALAITEDGGIVPTSGLGNTPAFVRNADKVIVEINLLKPLSMEGMADIYAPTNPPSREPIPILRPNDRIGLPYIACGPEKIAAVVFTEMQDDSRLLSKPGEKELAISRHIIRFLEGEVEAKRMDRNLLPLQSGVGNVANAIFSGLADSDFDGLTCYTEVVQDSMLDLLRSGKVIMASTTAISPSPEMLPRFEAEMNFFRDKIILRPQEISNNPETARRLGVIAMNTAIEADIYGNVNSTHIMGSRIMNGIGGSGDFARNAALTIFCTLSTAKDGKISSIVPMVSHVDHTEHDVMVLVTEQGYADLRGLSPRERASCIIENCAHPAYREKLFDYFRRAAESTGGQTPHLLDEALSWHSRYMRTGSMLPA